MVWYTLVAIIWKPPMLYLQTKCIMYSSYLGYYQLVAVHSQWTVQTLQTDSQKLVSSKLMKASFQLLMFLSEQGPFVAHLLQDIVVKSKPLGLDFYKAASCQQRHHGDNPSSPGVCSQLLHEESHVFWGKKTVDASNYSNSEGRRRKERFESSFISVFKTLLASTCYIDTIACLHVFACVCILHFTPCWFYLHLIANGYQGIYVHVHLDIHIISCHIKTFCWWTFYAYMVEACLW